LFPHRSGSVLVSTSKFYSQDYSHSYNKFENVVGPYVHFITSLPSFKFGETVNFFVLDMGQDNLILNS